MKGFFGSLQGMLKNGRFKWAIFFAFILSVSFTIFWFFKREKPATSKDLRSIIENQLLALENDEMVFRAWKQSQPKINVDTLKIFETFQKRRGRIDSVLEALDGGKE